MRTDDRPFCPTDNIEAGLLARVGAIDQKCRFPAFDQPYTCQLRSEASSGQVSHRQTNWRADRRDCPSGAPVVTLRKVRHRRVRNIIVRTFVCRPAPSPRPLKRPHILNADDHGNLGGEDITVGLGQRDLRRVSIDRTFFVEPLAVLATEPRDNLRKYDRSSLGKIGRHTLLLIVMILPIVLFAKQLAKLVDHGIAVLKAPPALGGVLIALIVFTPEAMSALRAALNNQLQRAVNLCLGAVSSTIGLTVPAILVIGLITGQPGRACSRPSQHSPSRGHTGALHDHVLRTAHNHSGGCAASSTVLRLHRSDF
jgi:hypothetical protein